MNDRRRPSASTRQHDNVTDLRLWKERRRWRNTRVHDEVYPGKLSPSVDALPDRGKTCVHIDNDCSPNHQPVVTFRPSSNCLQPCPPSSAI
jgi:hypothetical protein